MHFCVKSVGHLSRAQENQNHEKVIQTTAGAEELMRKIGSFIVLPMIRFR